MTSVVPAVILAGNLDTSERGFAEFFAPSYVPGRNHIHLALESKFEAPSVFFFFFKLNL